MLGTWAAVLASQSIKFCYICVIHFMHNERLKLRGSRKCQLLMDVQLSYVPLASEKTNHFKLICHLQNHGPNKYFIRGCYQLLPRHVDL